MGNHIKLNSDYTWVPDPAVKKNVFLNMKPDDRPLPAYESSKTALPAPYWPGHDNFIALYDKAWEIAFKNLRKANGEAHFVSDFIDTAFNGYLFMWDSSFIVMFGKYAAHIFDFQKTLDNFYSHQNMDGSICREICEEEDGVQFTRDDPVSTGPNVLPWAEWEYYLQTKDVTRLSKVFDPLLAYHHWLRLNRSWQDGSYWSTGWASGMDNLPRQDSRYERACSHGFMSWIDACAQMYLSADILTKMAAVLGREDEVGDMAEEKEMLAATINNTMWSEEDAFYYDKLRDGRLNGVKTLGSYWTMLAGLVSKDRIGRFVAHLENPDEFARKNPLPALSADHPGYFSDGHYWCGGVWAPTNYMTLTGLHQYGYDRLAHDIALRYVNTMTEVFEQTGTIWESYSPDSAAPGNPARKDFVGWSGLGPISILFEYVFGLHPHAAENTVDWYVGLTEEFGVDRYPLGDRFLDLRCRARKTADEEPEVTVRSSAPVTVRVHWGDGKTKEINC